MGAMGVGDDGGGCEIVNVRCESVYGGDRHVDSGEWGGGGCRVERGRRRVMSEWGPIRVGSGRARVQSKLDEWLGGTG